MDLTSANPTTVIALMAFVISLAFGMFATLITFLKYLIDKMSEKMDKHTEVLTGLQVSMERAFVKLDSVLDNVLGNDWPRNPPPFVHAMSSNA